MPEVETNDQFKQWATQVEVDPGLAFSEQDLFCMVGSCLSC